MYIKVFLVMAVLDIAIASSTPCYTASDQTKFDQITQSLQTAQNDLSALRQDYSNRVSPVCKHGWTSYRDHCYLYKPIVTTWTDAVKSCSDEGGSLVYINSDDENSWVADFCAGESCWIGANDQLKEGEWKWSHSWARVEFTNWNSAANEPNGGTSESCAMVYGKIEPRFKTWNDLPCGHNVHYICKMAQNQACNSPVVSAS